MTYEIFVGGQRIRVNSALSYKSTERLEPGRLVIVPLREQLVLGVVVRVSTDFHKKIKDIHEVLPYIIGRPQLELIRWLGVYYPAPLSATLQLFLPSLSITRAVIETEITKKPATLTLPPLTQEQSEALHKIQSGNATSYLLHGVTGSGKTRVYAELAKTVIKAGDSVIILTPEIGLTTPLVNYFEQVFGKELVICFHSGLTATARANAWATLAKTKKPHVIIGPRSALFLPVNKLGLIVVDESHDSAYKQEQQPFYHATRVAAKLATLTGAKCVMGSATPLLHDYHAFESKQLPIINMKRVAIKSDYSRQDNVIDLRDRSLFGRSQLISTQLLQAMERAVNKKQQVLLFLNRRGSARTILCQKCGWQELCPRCDIALTYHADKNNVLCHACAYQKTVPTQCPECKSADILFQTPGTKSIETEVKKLFPDAVVGRYDKDSSAGSKLHQSFEDINSGKIDILIGTQLLSKGLDLPRLSVIGLIQADSSMMLPDFSASERTFQQLSQVAGRLGRGHGDGQLFVQTYQPDRPLLKWALGQDYESFYKSELAERLQYNFPPACYLLVLQVKRATQSGASKAMQRVADAVAGSEGVIIGSPAPAFHEKRSNSYYWQVVVRSKDRTFLVALINKLPANTLHNIDPTDLL